MTGVRVGVLGPRIARAAFTSCIASMAGIFPGRLPDVDVVLLVLPRPADLDEWTLRRRRGWAGAAMVVTYALDPALKEAVRRGAVGVLALDDSVEDLLSGIQKLARGEPWCSNSLGCSLLLEARRAEAEPPGWEAGLCPLARTIIPLLESAMPGVAIARQLNVSESTFRRHVGSIYAARRVQNRREFILMAHRERSRQHQLRSDDGAPGPAPAWRLPPAPA